MCPSDRPIDTDTDTTNPAGMPRPRNTVASTRANRNETNNDDTNRNEANTNTERENRQNPILIDGDENEEQRMMTLEEFLQYASEEPEWLYEKLQATHQRYDDSLDDHKVRLAEEELRGQTKDGEIALLRRETEEMKGQLQDIKKQLTDVTAERDAFGSQIARLVMDSASGRRASPMPINSKSTKIPDPPMLTDGKEPRFEDWLLLMSQKLTANADHFDTSQLRIAYVASRCDGKARKHITPRMRDDAINPYTDSKDMLNHLKTIYDDPNRVTTAKHQFRQLYMKNSDKFHDFFSEFLYLAAEAGVAEDDWKDELYTKLTTKLQELCISSSIGDGTFQEFSSAVSQTASRLEVINHRAQKNRTFTPNKDMSKGTSRTGTTFKKEPTPSQSTNSTIPRMGNAERDQLMKEGRCFHCQEHGHLARDCSTKTPTPELKELEQKAPENEQNDDAGKV